MTGKTSIAFYDPLVKINSVENFIYFISDEKKNLFKNFNNFLFQLNVNFAVETSSLISSFTGVATAFSGSFWTFSLCRFLVGFAFDNCFTMMYILGKLWTIYGHDKSIYFS